VIMSYMTQLLEAMEDTAATEADAVEAP